MYCVYLLQDSKGQYYIGQTKNIQKRLELHNRGLVRSTKHRRPLSLVGVEKHNSVSEARWREYTLKKSAFQRQRFINKLSRGSLTRREQQC